MSKYFAEIFGTMLMILIGDSAVANVKLERSGMQGGGSVHITIAWGLAVIIPVLIFGDVSGAHFNPALTVAFALKKEITWRCAIGYILAQFAGAFIGAVFVYILFKDYFDETKDPSVKLSVFCTCPTIPNVWQNLFSEIVGTFILVFSIIKIGQLKILQTGLDKIFIFGVVVSIGMSFGGITGYAINPARDLGPRLAHTILPIKDKGKSNWRYAIVVTIGPVLGAIIAVLVNKIFFG